MKEFTLLALNQPGFARLGIRSAIVGSLLAKSGSGKDAASRQVPLNCVRVR